MTDGGVVRFGIHPLLEAAANEIIFGSLKGVTSQSAKSDVLTPWKEADRRSREVLSSSGTVDPAIRRGIYGRAINPQYPHLNSRDGVAPPPKHSESMQGDWPGMPSRIIT